MTFALAFRKLLVFDGGMAASYAQKASTRLFPWHQVNPASVRAVTTDRGSAPTALLAAGKLARLGVRGKYAIVFQATPQPSAPSAENSAASSSFWTFESDHDPAPLVHAIHRAMVRAGIPGAAKDRPKTETDGALPKRVRRIVYLGSIRLLRRGEALGEQAAQDGGGAVVVHGAGDLISNGLHGMLRLAHGHSPAGPAEHVNVVAAIAHRHRQ